MRPPTCSRILGFMVLLAFFAQFFTPRASRADAWLDNGWTYRIPFEAVPDSIEGTGVLEDFPVLLSLDSIHGGEVFTKARADGSDIVITASDGTTVLPREVVLYDAGAQSAEIWFRASQLSRTTNTFYMYYGNPDTTLALTPSDAWSPSYRGVYHFAEDPGLGLLRDSSPNGADAVLSASRNWTSGDVEPGQIHQAWSFNGTSHHIFTRSITTQDSSFVVSAWLKHVERGVDFVTQTNPAFWHVSSQRNGGGPRPDYVSGSRGMTWDPSPIPLDGQYHHFAWVFDGVEDTIHFYYDGQAQDPYFQPSPGVYTGHPLNPNGTEPVGILGPMFFNEFDLMDGGGDEFRIHEGTLSPEWMATEYRNQRHPVEFLSFFPEETNVVTAAGPLAASGLMMRAGQPNPFRESMSIWYSLAKPTAVSVDVYDLAGRRVRRLWQGPQAAGSQVMQWDGRGANGRRVAAGVYFITFRTPAVSKSAKVVMVD